ncbi:MAG: hypothetical protein OXI43_06640 [Candidatus Poribacteria bacterium]|nr:hypothetical protein [Candidatus Poribacteria bacterium]
MMENVTLEGVIERLDRLEKVVVDINLQLSLIVKQLVSNDSEICTTSEEATTANTQGEKEDADIGVKIIEEILERMGYPPDFDPGPIEELRESMRQHGIRAEDNEFSRAIIEEREK